MEQKPYRNVMTKGLILAENIDLAGLFVQPKDRALAEETWGSYSLTSRSEFQAILDAVKKGDPTAINFLFTKTLGKIGALFFKNFLGSDPSWRRRRLLNGDQHDFIAMVYQMFKTPYFQSLPKEEALQELQNNHTKAGLPPYSEEELQEEYDLIVNRPSPLYTFKVDSVKKDSELMSAFAVWIGGGLDNLIRVYNRAKAFGGLKGRLQKDKEEAAPQQVSYEAHFENEDLSPVYDERFNQELIDLGSWESFVLDEDLDSGNSPTLRTVLKLFLDQGYTFDVTKVANSLGVTNMTIRTKLSKMEDIFLRHELNREIFGRLMRTVGPHRLIDYL